MKILITGGAGFIGSALIRYLLTQTSHQVVCVDSLTYAANPAALASIAQHPHYHFEHTNICDAQAIKRIFQTHQPDAVMHLAAESHVDNSISHPGSFIESNIVGTYTLLESARAYYQQLSPDAAANFKFHHVSTDEVYGDVAIDSPLCFTEQAAYRPSSPYAASKASSDHLVRAWHRTYELPIVISASSNNYGPYQHSEKLIPTVITRALAEEPIPLYGNGLNQRDWLHVDDHVNALMLVLLRGKVGESYHISAANWHSNHDIVLRLCQHLDTLRPRANGESYSHLITYVTDRLGHDQKYAIDASKIRDELGWYARINFEQGLRQTVEHYLRLYQHHYFCHHTNVNTTSSCL